MIFATVVCADQKTSKAPQLDNGLGKPNLEILIPIPTELIGNKKDLKAEIAMS